MSSVIGGISITVFVFAGGAALPVVDLNVTTMEACEAGKQQRLEEVRWTQFPPTTGMPMFAERVSVKCQPVTLTDLEAILEGVKRNTAGVE